MAKYTCPSCGAAYNGKKCRACLYENFAEEIAHGSHTHQGEPLVIDAPGRRPSPRKDPCGCPKPARKRKTARQKNPVLRFLLLLLVLYGLLPLVRNWGLELEERETAARMEMAVPENLVTLYEEGHVTVSVQSNQISHFADGLRIWVKNDSSQEYTVTAHYVTANGFVMENASVYVKCAPNAYGMGTLYVNEEDMACAGITQVQSLSFVLDVTDEYNVTILRTDPITLSTTPEPVEPEWKVEGALTLMDEDGIYLETLGYWPDTQTLKYEDGYLLFYVENNTDSFLYMDSVETVIGGKPAALFLWSGLPAHSRAVVKMELWALEEWKITTPSELGNLEMTLEFWDPENYEASIREYRVTMPMVREEPLVIS